MANFVSYKGFHWEYETFGSGNEMLIALHGFGNHSSDFSVLERSLGKKYTIVAFNLPYHGASYTDESTADKSVSKDDLKELFRRFFQQHNVSRFSLMGYSLGGKIVLQLIELFPDQINSVFLIAPDGIRNNWSNGFVTRNHVGKRLYQRIVHDPSRFLRFVRMLKSMNLIHEKLSDFLHLSMNTQSKRQQVWDVWMCFRDIKPDISNVQKIINKNKIRLHLFFGKFDRIIPPAIGENFIRHIDNKDSLHIVEMGHVMVKEKLNDYLMLAIKD